jgi:hypothetical protein
MAIDSSLLSLFSVVPIQIGNKNQNQIQSLQLPSTAGTSGTQAFPGGSIAYYNYLNKNGDKLQQQSNNSPAVTREVQYFLSRIGVKTAAKATSLVKLNANLSQADAPGTTRTATTTVYDSDGNKYTLTLNLSKTTTDTWQAALGSVVDASGNKTTATISNATPQTLVFNPANGKLTSTIGSVSLGTVTLSNGATLAPKFNFDSGAPNGGLVTEKPNSTFAVTSVQADGNPPVAQGSKPIKSVDDIFKDNRLFTFILNALGLGDQVQNVGLVKKALTEKLFDSNGQPVKGTLVSKLKNPKLTDAAQTLDLGDVGLKAIENPVIMNALIAGYQTNHFEQGIANNDPSVASARYFSRNIAHAVSSATTTTNAAFAILGDAVLRDVVTTALNIPAGGLASLPVEGQAQLITSKVNVNSFKNPSFVASFVSRYLNTIQSQANMADLQASGGGQIGLANFGLKV